MSPLDHSAGRVVLRALVALVAFLALGCGRVGYVNRESGVVGGGTDSGMDARTTDSGTAGDTSTPPPAPICGDGEVNGADVCDDGNGVNGDGCENDCTYTCTVEAECDDGAACNGSERCSAVSRICEDGTAIADGTTCSGGACRGGSCAPPGCGNGVIDAGEDCDDSNLIDGDACDNDCTYSCVTDGGCDDGDPCTTDMCAGNLCDVAVSLADGDACDRDGAPATRDLCLDGTCLPSICGDAFVDLGATPVEACDDGNLVPDDGCEADCTFTCLDAGDCDDGDVCNGRETCDLASHRCSPGTPAATGAPCPGGACLGGSCLGVPTDSGTPIDSGIGMVCVRDRDCTGGGPCCDQCFPLDSICYPVTRTCPEILCTFDGGF